MIKKIKIKFKIKARLRGAYLPAIMMASVLFIALAVSVISISTADLKLSRTHEKNVSSLDVAEAGVNYYMWHLSHNNKDYCDGQTCTASTPYGPYTHEFRDPSGKIIGTYELYITPPELGNSVTTVKSIGRINNNSGDRIVTAELGMPSFARYAFLVGTECWFGNNETTNGPVHSNVGIHFDGTANGIVSASRESYTPSSSFGGDGNVHDGVWGDGGPKNYWVFPVPPVDFNRVSIDFANLKLKSSTGGLYLTKSNSLGYYLKLKSDGKIDLYRVSRERSSGITTTFLRTENAPGNGIIYVEDNVWVDGTYNGRITIAAHTSGSGQPTIKIKNNLLYTAKDGSSAVGLVAEGNIEVPEYAVNTLEIDAALLSQTGHVWFPNVSGSIKDQISIYGSISTYLTWTWTWVSGSNVTSGYRNTSQSFDPFLTLEPPPEFPTTGSYAILSWREE